MKAVPDSVALPRRISAKQYSPPPSNMKSLPGDAGAAEMAATLEEIRGRVDQVTGLLMATADGLVLGSATDDVEDDSIAAMSAAAIGLATQFTRLAEVGAPRAAMFEGVSGHVCVFPVEDATLLVVFGEPDITTGLFTVAAKQALSLVQQALRPETRAVRDKQAHLGGPQNL